jgi:hypothetical protein
MAEQAGDPDALGLVGPNRDILDRIAEGATRAADGAGPWSPDGWVMRTHPDLTEAIEAAATSAMSIRVELLYGLASAVTGSLIVGVGIGTSAVWLRVPDGPAFDRARDEGARPVEALTDWLSVDAWRVDLAAWLRASEILTRDRWPADV